MNNKVLIIDDEADIRFLLRRALSAHEYAVAEAETLKQGLEIFRETNPDIVILDVNLPDGSGTYYARRFKNETNIVIFISADHDKLAEGYKDAGANGFLKKPFVIDQLLDIIKHARTNSSTLN